MKLKSYPTVQAREPKRPDERFAGEVETYDPATGTVTIKLGALDASGGAGIALYNGARVQVVTGRDSNSCASNTCGCECCDHAADYDD